MRGWPLVEAVVVAGLLGVFGLVFGRLIERGDDEQALEMAHGVRSELGVTASEQAEVGVDFHFQTTGNYKWVVFREGGRELHRVEEGVAGDGWFHAVFPADGVVEVVVEIKWCDEEARHALGVEAAPDGLESQTLTLWGEGLAQGVLVLALGGAE